jgi:hypothetical protein
VKKTASLFNLPTYYSLPSSITVVLNYPQAIVASNPAPQALGELKQAEPRLVYLRDKEVVLYRINRSRMWQVRFRLNTLVRGRRQWHRLSTKTAKFEDAKRIACD